MIYYYQYTKDNDEQSLADLTLLLLQLNISKDVVLIKVNWANDKPGYFTDCQTLAFIIKALQLAYQGIKIIIIESYSYERNDPQLIYFPNRAKQRKEIIRNNETTFLEKHHFYDLFQKNSIEYINLTEELWDKRTVNPKIIHSEIKQKYQYKLKHQELTRFVPEKLLQYQDKTLISLTKIKGWLDPSNPFFSLTMKNLFGLIPIPCRRKYHGKHDRGLISTIIDANIIYRSLFDVIGIGEAIFNTRFMFEYKINVLKNPGCLAASRDLVTLDAGIINSLGYNPFERHMITDSEKVFNPVNKAQIEIENIRNSINLAEIQESNHG